MVVKFTGYIPFLQAFSFLLAIIGFVQILHDQPMGFMLLSIGVIAFFVFFTLWVWTLLITLTDDVGDDAGKLQRAKKLQWAIRLVLFWMFTFSVSFALIPMYYWLNGSGMHVHGGADMMSSVSDVTPVGRDEKVSVYLSSQIDTDSTPLRFHISPKVVSLSPGGSLPVSMDIHNTSQEKQTYRLVAKVAPDVAKDFVSFPYLDKHRDIVIEPGATLKLDADIRLSDTVPKIIGDISMTLFLFTDKVQGAWKKMQNSWNP